MRVLLIEDDSATAQSIELMLKSESFNVYTTDLGEEGVDLGKLYDYDIILLDLNLPDMSGFEVLRSLRVSKVKTPILILDRKSTRLNSSHTVIYTLSLHDALPILRLRHHTARPEPARHVGFRGSALPPRLQGEDTDPDPRSEEHTSELQSHSDLHPFPTRRSSDLTTTTSYCST